MSFVSHFTSGAGRLADAISGLGADLAAAGFKARWGNSRGMRANAATAARLFRSAARQLGPQSQRYMGLDVRALGAYAEALRDGPPLDDPEAPGGLRFDLVLRPE